MKKEILLEIISKMEWHEDSWDKSDLQLCLEKAVSNYVVYMEDPDTHCTYGHEFHLTKEDAMADCESRTTSERLFYCVVSALNGEFYYRRELGCRLFC